MPACCNIQICAGSDFLSDDKNDGHCRRLSHEAGSLHVLIIQCLHVLTFKCFAGADFLPDDANDGHCRRLSGGNARLEVLPHRRPGPASSSLLL